MHRWLPISVLVACSVASAGLAAAAPLLFPRRLHLVRAIDDPVTRRTTTIDQYCDGNRVVSVNAAAGRTTLVDYDAQQVTDIDRGAGTYSISRFDEIAAARPARSAAAAGAPRWNSTPRGSRGTATSRTVEEWELEPAGGGSKSRMTVAIDRGVVLSRDAAGVLIGAAYPNARTSMHDALLEVSAARRGGHAAATSTGEEQYGLVSEQTLSYEVGGSPVTVRNVVTAIDDAPLPAGALLIDPAARRVGLRSRAVDKELRDLDRLPFAPSKPQ